MLAFALGYAYLLAGLVIFRGERARGFLSVVAWPLALAWALVREVRRRRAMEPLNSHPGRVVPRGVPVVQALRERPPDPPDRSTDAEKALLGAMIFDPGVIPAVLGIVEGAEMFAFPPHRLVFEALLALHRRGEPFDLVALKEAMERDGNLEAAGGAASLADLVNSTPAAANALEYARTVRDKYDRRVHAGEDPREVKEVLPRILRELDDFCAQEVPPRRLYPGFRALDDLIGNLRGGCLYVVAGRPSMGKTSFLLRMVENAALKDQASVLLFSPQQEAVQVAWLLLGMHARVDLNLLRRGRAEEEDYQRLVLAAGAFHEAGIRIDDAKRPSVQRVVDLARRSRPGGLDLLAVDGITCLRPDPEPVPVSTRLKALARELGIPVVVTVPLGRGPEERRDPRPVLDDLSGPRSISEDADAVMLLYRQEYYDINAARKGVCEVIVAKNRFGPPGTADLAFVRRFARFEDLS